MLYFAAVLYYNLLHYTKIFLLYYSKELIYRALTSPQVRREEEEKKKNIFYTRQYYTVLYCTLLLYYIQLTALHKTNLHYKNTILQ